MKEYSRSQEDKESYKYKYNQLFSKSPNDSDPVINLYDIKDVEKALDLEIKLN